MKNVLLLFFALVFSTSAFSQSDLDKYSFVVIPKEYSFLKEADQFQLNSLTKFLFNKHGFHAFFENELPAVDRCQGLWAEVIGKPSIIWTRVTISLNDCKGNTVFKSEEGRSKLKQFNKTYTDALRKAFASIEVLDVKQSEIETLVSISGRKSKGEKISAVKESPKLEAAISSEEAISNSVIENVATYTNNGDSYILAEHKSSYSLYEGNSLAENLEDRRIKGTITKNENGSLVYSDTSRNSFPCSFDSNQNLVVETSFQKIVFKRVN